MLISVIYTFKSANYSQNVFFSVAASTLMSATSIPSVVWPSPLATEPYSTAAHYQQGATIRGPSYSAIQPIPTCHCPPSSSTSPAVTMTSNEVCNLITNGQCVLLVSRIHLFSCVAMLCVITCAAHTQTVDIPLLT